MKKGKPMPPDDALPRATWCPVCAPGPFLAPADFHADLDALLEGARLSGRAWRVVLTVLPQAASARRAEFCPAGRFHPPKWVQEVSLCRRTPPNWPGTSVRCCGP